jgi:hypothetical protein
MSRPNLPTLPPISGEAVICAKAKAKSASKKKVAFGGVDGHARLQLTKRIHLCKNESHRRSLFDSSIILKLQFRSVPRLNMSDTLLTMETV